MQQKLYYHIKKKRTQAIISSEFLPWTAFIPQTQNSALDVLTRIMSHIRRNGSWTFDFPQTKLWSPFKHDINVNNLPLNSLKLSAGIPRHEHHCLFCFTRGEVNTAARWVAVTVLTDANLLCIHALMCVNRQPRPRDQRGLCLDYLHCLNWTLIMTRCYGCCWHQTLAYNPQPLSGLIMCQLLTFTRCELSSADRWLSTRAREVTAVNTVPELPPMPCLWSSGSSMWHRDRVVMWQRDKEIKPEGKKEDGSERRQIFKCGTLTGWKMAI